MYNKLGLALGEMGTDPGSAKEAFSEGLLLAPDDLALLVNGGAAHQVTVRFSSVVGSFHETQEEMSMSVVFHLA